MKKYFLIAFLLCLTIISLHSVRANELQDKLKGKILLKVEDAGKAYYVDPKTGTIHYLGKPDDAFAVMREKGIGISNMNLYKIPVGIINNGVDSDKDGLSDSLEKTLKLDITKIDTDGDGFDDKNELTSGYNPWGTGKQNIDYDFANNQKGKILLQVEENGEAWYVNPADGKRYFLGKPVDAFNVMRKFGLGISNKDMTALETAVLTTKNEAITGQNISKGSMPKEMIGLWRYKELKLLKNGTFVQLYDNGTFVNPKLERVPLGLNIKSIKAEGICSGSTFAVEGNELGLNCRYGYLPIAFSGNNITLPEKHIFAENFNGFNISGYFTGRIAWIAPTEYKVENGELSFISKNKSGTESYYFVYEKVNYPFYNPVDIKLSVNQAQIKAGTDLVINGHAKTKEVVRIFFYLSSSEILTNPANNPEVDSPLVNMFSVKGCEYNRCNEFPIITKGKEVPVPVAEDGKKSNTIEMYDEKYFSCPFYADKWENLDGDKDFILSEVLCVIPDDNGDFEIKLFNNGVSSFVGYQDKIPFIVNAKLAANNSWATAKTNFVTCEATTGLERDYKNFLTREKCAKIGCDKFEPKF